MANRFHRPAKPVRRPIRLTLESLEDRCVPAVFNVNSLADVLNPGPGVVTLRSAVQAANTDGDATNTINLTLPGTYKITLAGTPGETDNQAGEFAVLPTAGDLTIQNTSGGAVAVDGNHLSRVLDINPNFDPANPTPKFLVTLTGFTVQNGAVTDAANADGPNASGGGVRDMGNASLTLNNVVVTGNTATADGGGVAMENTVSVPWTLTVNNSVISGNHAGDAGGGLETDGSGKVFVTDSIITGNTCVNQGAGIWLDAIEDGADFQGANLTVTGSVVSGNSAETMLGGGIGNAGNGTVTISNSTISDNFAGTTGGGFGDVNAQGTLIVRNSVFLQNSAVAGGGGIAVGGPTAAITNAEIDANSTAASGGGIFANGATLTISNATIADDTAAVNGGGVELETTGADAAASTLTNVTITGNSALNSAGTLDGGGIDAPAAFTGAATLFSGTINGNFATNGGGVFFAGTAGSTFALQNTILAGNNAATGPDASGAAAFTDDGGNFVGVAGAAGGNTGLGAANGGLASTQAGTAAAPLDPMLGPLQNNGGPTIGAPGAGQVLQTEALLQGSNAIDMGVAGAPATDARGLTRPDVAGTNPDVGAFEFRVVQTTTGNTTTGGMTTPPPNPFAGLSAQEHFVQALYLADLGRAGSRAELDGWAALFNAPGVSQAQAQGAIATAIDHSPEARDALVKGWYVAFLGRQAQNGEESGWVSALLHGQTEEQVLSAILASPEFYARAQTLGGSGSADQQYVQALYMLLLNRAGEAPSVASLAGILPSVGRQAVALGFLTSPEFRGDQISGFYNALLHRPADAAGLNGWIFSTLNLDAVRLGLETSPEFFTNG